MGRHGALLMKIPAKSLSPRGQMLLSVLIFGTVGLFVRLIPLPSALIACARGVIGAVCILLYMRVRALRPDAAAIRRNALMLLLSGAALGFNWAFLFEAYRYTTVATATLCYYLAPTLVMLLSPVLLHEKLTVRKLLCCLVALLGMVFVSGAAGGGLPQGKELTGILWGLASAVCYAGVMIFNKKLRDVAPYDRTVMQLGISAVLMLLYAALTGQPLSVSLPAVPLLMLLIVGVVHTGVAYLCYFGALRDLKAQSAAILSYIDPVAAILLSWLILSENPGWHGLIGAALILGSAVMSERRTEKQ